MIAGDPPIPTPPATSPLPSLVLDLEPAVAGLPRGINVCQIYVSLASEVLKAPCFIYRPQPSKN